MATEPTFLTREMVLKLHKRSIEHAGEIIQSYDALLWIRDEVALESALFAPQATFDGEFLFASVAAMAAAYWHSFTSNHPFTDGNKRVALASASIFLRINGFQMTFSEEEAEELTLKMATGEISRENIIALLEDSVAIAHTHIKTVE